MRRGAVVLAVLGVVSLFVTGAFAASGSLSAARETEAFYDDEAGGDADADDPAVWLHPSKRAQSIVVGTLKNAGLAVFDLKGTTLQRITPTDLDGDAGRFNNVDVVYGATIGGKTQDLAVVTDRGLDRIRVYAIHPDGAKARIPLSEVSAPDVPVVFDGVEAQESVYGVATWKAPNGKTYVFVSQRHDTTVAMLKLVATPSGISYEEVDRLSLPLQFDAGGATWTPCTEEDEEEPQVEGMVADGANRRLFAGQEDIGIWSVEIGLDGFGKAALLERVKEFGQAYDRQGPDDDGEYSCELDEASPSFGDGHLAADVEGLTIYHDGPGAPSLPSGGYLLASSQGDDTFAAYLRTPVAGKLQHLGQFEVVDGAIDGVQESDGATIVEASLPQGFAKGLFVTQDGDAQPESDTEDRDATAFKLARWADVARAAGLQTDTSFDPRTP